MVLDHGHAELLMRVMHHGVDGSRRRGHLRMRLLLLRGELELLLLLQDTCDDGLNRLWGYPVHCWRLVGSARAGRLRLLKRRRFRLLLVEEAALLGSVLHHALVLGEPVQVVGIVFLLSLLRRLVVARGGRRSRVGRFLGLA